MGLSSGRTWGTARPRPPGSILAFWSGPSCRWTANVGGMSCYSSPWVGNLFSPWEGAAGPLLVGFLNGQRSGARSGSCNVRSRADLGLVCRETWIRLHRGKEASLAALRASSRSRPEGPKDDCRESFLEKLQKVHSVTSQEAWNNRDGHGRRCSASSRGFLLPEWGGQQFLALAWGEGWDVNRMTPPSIICRSPRWRHLHLSRRSSKRRGTYLGVAQQGPS